MKFIMRNILFLVILFSIGNVNSQSRTKVNFGSDWEFKREGANANWEIITIPHTAKIEPLVVNDQFQGNCWYQKKFTVSNAKNKKVFLYFEGVMQEADVWINEQKMTNHKGGYLPFTVDVTSFLKSKVNTIKVKVNNEDNPEFLPGKPLKDLDFNYYGGIYRNVYLITTDKLYITNPVAANKKASGGIYVNFENVNKNRASGTVQVHLKNEFAVEKKTSLKYFLSNKEGERLEFKSEEFIINANSDKTITQNIVVNNPKLWSISKPNLKILFSKFEKCRVTFLVKKNATSTKEISKVNCKKSFTCFGTLIDSIACITDAPLLISVIN